LLKDQPPGRRVATGPLPPVTATRQRDIANGDRWAAVEQAAGFEDLNR
jgi:hypothetical protein